MVDDYCDYYCASDGGDSWDDPRRDDMADAAADVGELLRLRAIELELLNEVRNLRAQLDAQRRLNDMLQESMLNCTGADEDAAMTPSRGCRYTPEHPIVTACRSGDVAMVDTLVDTMGTEGECDGIFADSLQAACQHGRIEIVRLLLERFGSSVGQRLVHADHNSSLLWACRNGDESLVRLLIEHGADAGALGGCPLRLAVHGGFTGIARLILERRNARPGPQIPP